MNIIPGKKQDAKILSDLTFRSKAHWGYAPEQMEAWRADLTITEDYIAQNHVYMLVDQQHVPGYYSFFEQSSKMVKLDNLFVDPDFIGLGFGGQLIEDFMSKSRQLKFQTMTLDADPHAESFYKKYGFQSVGRLATSIPGRYLPVMELQL